MKWNGIKVLIMTFSQFFAHLGSSREEPEKHHERPPIPSPVELKKLPRDGGPKWNRLVFERSPYLLQHAANPVDWHPWGEDAFKKAIEENKPIFLSIGYSTCHWCHVMERESFEDEEVAALLNKYFIAIKVDREERPDVDDIYMNACRAMTGSGGWPLTVVLDHKKRPFFAGTYFPKKSRYGRAGMMELLPKIAETWKDHREQLEDHAAKITEFLKNMNVTGRGPKLSVTNLENAYRQLAGRYDTVRGGFGRAPKFPTPHQYNFLLRYWKRTGEAQALEMVRESLLAMRRGGIFDHVGFGFHRYATDSNWLVPHFEKMLYDQALLAIAYLETYQATGEAVFAETAREIFAYVLRDMTAPEGGFYSAEDADSEGEEGKFYLWTPGEVIQVLGPEEGKFFNKVYSIVKEGNFQAEVSGGAGNTGLNIPHMKKNLTEIAGAMKITREALRKRLEASRRKLFKFRETRIHPLKDDKILTDWNGLMITALALGAKVLNEPEYAQAAQNAAWFLLTECRDVKGRLLKRYRAGHAGLPAHLDDYAFLARGLLELYEATFDVRLLEHAVSLSQDMINLFWDGESGGFFFTANDGELLIMRSKTIYDGALPSGNSVAVDTLIRLHRLTANEAYGQLADELLATFSSRIQDSGNTQLYCALDFVQGPSHEVVIAGKTGAPDTLAMVSRLYRPFNPNKVVVFRPEEDPDKIGKIAAYTKDQKALEGKATAYVCQNFACKRPTTDIETMLKNLEAQN